MKKSNRRKHHKKNQLTPPITWIGAKTGINKMSKTINLLKPIINGENKITTLTFREPLAGDLRGVTLIDFVSIDINAAAKVLPRITTPTITSQEVYKMPLADLSAVMEVVATFLDPNSTSVPTESQTE